MKIISQTIYDDNRQWSVLFSNRCCFGWNSTIKPFQRFIETDTHKKRKHEIRNEMTHNKKTINVLSVLHDSMCFPCVDLNVFSSCFKLNRNHVFNRLAFIMFVLSNFWTWLSICVYFSLNEHTNLMQILYFSKFSLVSKLHQIDFYDHETVTHQSK